MGTVDHDMRFTFIHAGWEGSAHDGRVFNDAISNPRHGFDYPPTGFKYMLYLLINKYYIHNFLF